jgi:hypothetical protein
MNRISLFWVRLLNLFRRSKLDSDLIEQLEAHRQMIKEDLIQRGMEPALAERRAREAMGNDTLVRELSSDEMSYQWFKSGTRIQGATEPTLRLVNVKTDDAARYTVTATNASGLVTRIAAPLTVK